MKWLIDALELLLSFLKRKQAVDVVSAEETKEDKHEVKATQDTSNVSRSDFADKLRDGSAF